MSWEAFRDRFPVTRELAWLDCATHAPAATPVLEALRGFEADWAAGRGDWRGWETAGERARASFARLLGVEPGLVALVPDAASGLAQVAERVPFRPGANLVVGAGEFRSNLYPWLNQRRRGFELRLVPVHEGRMRAEDWLAAVDGRTACVAVSTVQSASGQRLPLEPLKAACLQHGARLCLDATQSAGVLRLDLAGVDFVVAAGYKWLLGPRGCAYLHVARGRLDELEPVAPGWKAAREPYADYYGPPLELAPDARKLDHSLGWLAWAGAAAGLELLEGEGLERIEARALELAERFVAGLEPLGLAPLLPAAERAQVIALEVGEPERARAALRSAGVVAAVRGRWLRVGFHALDDESDVERALAALATASGATGARGTRGARPR